MTKRYGRRCFVALAAGLMLCSSTTRADFTVPIRAGSTIHFVWVGDLNGDGNMDYVVDRPTDNQQKIEAYTHNGTFLWDVDFGPNSMNKDNIEPGSATIDVGHWDGVTVSDLNNDGRAEVIIKIANGVRFGDGSSWANSDNNKQWIAVLEGSTGRLLNYAAVPTDYLADGPMGCHLGVGNAGIFASMKNRVGSGAFNMMVCRYTWSGSSLTMNWKWLRGSQNCPDGHQIRVCDVNGDGTDDFCSIGFVLNGSNGSLLYTLGTQGVIHGDRFHIAKMDPSRSGLQGFGVQQDNPSGLLEYYYDAGNGTMLWKHMGTVADVGRGDVGDIDPRYAGYEGWSFSGIYNLSSNTKITSEPTRPYPSLRLWWDADDMSESYNDGKIEKWNSTNSTVARLVTTWNYESAVSSDRGAPMFYGDFLGDWREEVVLANSSFNKLVIFTPPGTSNTRGTLRNDRYYKNCLTVKGYMQSHHTSFYIGIGGSGGGFPAAGTYSLRNRSSGRMLDNLGVSTNGANVAQWDDGSSNNQRWNLSYVSSSVVKLQCVTGSRYLDGMGRTSNGSLVGQWDNGSSNNQRWTIIDAGSGYFKLKNVATGLCLDVGASPWANGDPVEQWPDGSSQNQHWQFVTP